MFTSLSLYVTETINRNFIQKLSPEKTLLFFSPILKKVKGSPTTLHYQLQQSNIQPAAVSIAFRRILRPRGAYYKKLKNADPAFSHSNLLTDLNSGKVSAALPKKAPDNISTIDNAVTGLPTGNTSPLIKWLLANNLLALLILLAILLLVALASGAWIAFLVLAAAAIALYIYSNKLKAASAEASVINDPAALATTLAAVPPQPNFTFTETDPVIPVVAAGSTTVTQITSSSSASANAIKFSTVTSFTRAPPARIAWKQKFSPGRHYIEPTVNHWLRPRMYL